MKPGKVFKRIFTTDELSSFNNMIGCGVWKNHKTSTKHEPKPFKSGLKINTVVAIVPHYISGYPAFTFIEDESMVECFRCSLAPTNRYEIIQS